MSIRKPFTKEQLDGYLKALGKAYRKLSGKQIPSEIILIGGASVLLNYGFRDMTDDADAIFLAQSTLKDAIRQVTDEFDELTQDWLNDDFKKSPSYTDRLIEKSKFYKTFSNILQVRTIKDEYLIAMKLMASQERTYKHDRSDVIGILWEHDAKGNPISLAIIEKAFEELYDTPLPNKSRKFIENAIARGNYENLYAEIKTEEKENRDILKEFNEEYGIRIKRSDIGNTIERMKQKKARENNDESSAADNYGDSKT